MNRNIVFGAVILFVAGGVFFANCGVAAPAPGKVAHPFIAQCFRLGNICIVSAKGEVLK